MDQLNCKTKITGIIEESVSTDIILIVQTLSKYLNTIYKLSFYFKSFMYFAICTKEGIALGRSGRSYINGNLNSKTLENKSKHYTVQ